MELDIRVTGRDHRRTVRLEGSCDLASAPKLRQVLRELIPPEVTELEIDLAELEYIDSTGLGVIFGALRRLREGGGDVHLTGAGGSVRRVLEVTGLDKVFGATEPSRPKRLQA